MRTDGLGGVCLGLFEQLSCLIARLTFDACLHDLCHRVGDRCGILANHLRGDLHGRATGIVFQCRVVEIGDRHLQRGYGRNAAEDIQSDAFVIVSFGDSHRRVEHGEPLVLGKLQLAGNTDIPANRPDLVLGFLVGLRDIEQRVGRFRVGPLTEDFSRGVFQVFGLGSSRGVNRSEGFRARHDVREFSARTPYSHR